MKTTNEPLSYTETEIRSFLPTGWDLAGNGMGAVPIRPNDGVDVLFWRYPSARVLMSSPAVLLLRYVQRAFPVFTPPSVQDSRPLMHAPAGFHP
jgi:nitrous oxidase accessory protein